MFLFIYEAKDGPSKNVKGTIEAQTQEEAVEKIHKLGFIPIKVNKYSPEKDTDIRKPVSRSSFMAKVPDSKNITIFTQQLSSLLKSGVSILRSLKIISEQSGSALLKGLLQNVHNDIGKGSTLSDALARYPDAFSQLYISMVRAGENSGKLHEILLSIASYRRRVEESVSKVRTAMVYPALMALVGLGTIIFMLVFVMPRIINLLDKLGQKLPLPTQIVIWISVTVRENWPWILMGIIIISIALSLFSKTRLKNRIISIISINLPIIRNFIKMIELARFSRTMELLLASGVPVLGALGLATPIVQNEIIKEKLLKCYKAVEQGDSFGRTLDETKAFPAFMVNLIIVAEESGRFDEVFEEISSSYERETDEALKAMMSLLEPVMILIMGLIVGFVVIAMLLPIFEINLMTQ